jgi:hypothetical protein
MSAAWLASAFFIEVRPISVNYYALTYGDVR